MADRRGYWLLSTVTDLDRDNDAKMQVLDSGGSIQSSFRIPDPNASITNTIKHTPRTRVKFNAGPETRSVGITPGGWHGGSNFRYKESRPANRELRRI